MTEKYTISDATFLNSLKNHLLKAVQMLDDQETRTFPPDALEAQEVTKITSELLHELTFHGIHLSALSQQRNDGDDTFYRHILTFQVLVDAWIAYKQMEQNSVIPSFLLDGSVSRGYYPEEHYMIRFYTKGPISEEDQRYILGVAGTHLVRSSIFNDKRLTE